MTVAFSVPADASVKQLLDIGSRMLLYFEYFEPRYKRAFGDTATDVLSYEKLHERYYEQNGLDEAALVDTFEAVSAAAKMMTEQYGIQETNSKSIAQAWQGDAASAALGMLDTQLRLAAADATVAKGTADALEKAPTGLRAAVKIKADMVLHILENGVDIKIDGKTPDDVDAIISGAKGITWSNLWSDDSAAGKIRRIFPDMEEGFVDGMITSTTWLSGGLLGPGSAYGEMAKKRCQHWLDNVFKPDYANKTTKFLEACDRTHSAVTQVYDTIIDAVRKLSEEKYPRPAGTSSPNTSSEDNPSSSNPASSNPASSNPASTNPASTNPSTDTPTSTPSSNPTSTDTDDDSTDPANTSNPLSGLTNLSQIADQLSPLLSSLTEGVQSALTSLTTTIDTEIDKALENLQNLTSTEDDPAEGTGEDKDGDGKPDAESEPLAEFDLAGKEVTFEQGADGLKMVVTNPDGTTTEYRMTIDENGVPLVSAVEGETGEPAGEDQGEEDTPAEGTPASEEQPAGSGPVPSAPAPAEQEEDGEYTPQPIPAPEFTEDEDEAPAPAEPVSDQPPVGDTGALLAEAGPL